MMRYSTLERKTPMKRGKSKMRPRKAGKRTTKTLYRNAGLLALAEGQDCLIRIPDVCCGDPETVVSCHSNQSRHGKAGALKAHDWAIAWGCFTCHRLVDQSSEPEAVKVAYWEDGFKRTRLRMQLLGLWPAEAERGYLLIYGQEE